MAEVLVRFTERVRNGDGAFYAAQACGGVGADGLWEGWIEFVGDVGSACRSPRETQQPNRDALVYWAEGLTATYLEGALARALNARMEPSVRIPTAEPSLFNGPASADRAVRSARGSQPVLDPFASYAAGEDVLRRQLAALSRDHLQTLVDAYALPITKATSATDGELVDEIVRAVRRLTAAK